MMTLQTTAIATDAPLRRLGRVLAPLAATISRRLRAGWAYWATVEDLRHLSDRELDDMGLTRSEIGHAAWRAVHDGPSRAPFPH